MIVYHRMLTLPVLLALYRMIRIHFMICDRFLLGMRSLPIPVCWVYLFLGVDLLFEFRRGDTLGEIIVRGGIRVNIKGRSEAFSSLLFGGNRELVFLFLESVDAFEIILVFTPAHGGRTVGRLF